MMRRLLIAVVLIGLAMPVVAQDEAPRDRAQQRVAEFLQLSEQQVSDWEALLATREETVDPLRDEIEADGEALAAMLDTETPDPTAVGELTIAIHDGREAIGEAHQSYVEGFEALLEEEQAARLTFVRRADRAQRLLPAFRAFGLLAR